MNNPPEDQADGTSNWSQDANTNHQSADPPAPEPSEPIPFASQFEPPYLHAETGAAGGQGPAVDPSLFQSWELPNPRPAPRIPHIGHLLMLIPLLCIGFIFALVFFFVGVHFHLFGATSIQQAGTDIHYMLCIEAVMYLFAFAAALLVFPAFWQETLFAGIQWRGSFAVQRFWMLFSVALGCFILAWLDGVFLPGPANAPIEKMIRTPGAAWMMFGFGVTIAPFFEEMFFRGFLLPTLCTAWDWMTEHSAHKPAPPHDLDGHPQWSQPAMIFGSILTSLAFAGIHVEQQGHSLSPFLLLIVVSLVLCAVRLKTRSLAASVLVHASYNFMLFSLMLVASGGFRHLDKM